MRERGRKLWRHTTIEGAAAVQASLEFIADGVALGIVLTRYDALTGVAGREGISRECDALPVSRRADVRPGAADTVFRSRLSQIVNAPPELHQLREKLAK